MLRDIHSVWHLPRFAEPRTPLILGTVDNPAAFSRGEAVHVSDLPIKFPHTEYSVPNELVHVASALQRCIDFEHAVNPYVDDYYMYVTVHTTTVSAGEAPRGMGVHSDSVQGPRIVPKLPIEHGYLCVDRDPPRFLTHGFDMTGQTEHRDFLSAAFEKQANFERSFRAQPYEIVFFDAYCVHTALTATKAGRRTFFRLIASVRTFDRLGNTHNDLFDYDWKMVPRPLPPGLRGVAPHSLGPR